MTEEKKTEKLQTKVRVFNRLLIIQHHVEDFYGVDCWRLGSDRPESTNKKYTNVLYLGTVLLTYTRLFGRLQAPTAYTAYAQLCNRERTTAHHWLKLAKNLLHVYPKKRDEFERFVDERWFDIHKQCSQDEKSMRGEGKADTEKTIEETLV